MASLVVPLDGCLVEVEVARASGLDAQTDQTRLSLQAHGRLGIAHLHQSTALGRFGYNNLTLFRFPTPARGCREHSTFPAPAAAVSQKEVEAMEVLEGANNLT